MALQKAGARRPRQPRIMHNVARPERVMSVTVGAALVAYGMRRRDTVGIAAAIVGGVFLHRGATGNCPVYNALGISTGDAEAILDAPLRRGVRRR